jgi:site-specific DNA-methyltransferase (adenine-specific)
MIQLYNGDCLEVMKQLPSGSVDLVLCDLPYGTTACKWDVIIPFTPLWVEYKRLTKQHSAHVFTASQPFTSSLIMSNLEMFRYTLVWDKVNKYTGYANANKMPLRRHEDIAVFYRSLPTFNKQMRVGNPYKAQRTKGAGEHMGRTALPEMRVTENSGWHNPCSIIEIKGDNKLEAGFHPTQKPVALMEYLIKTYTNPGDTVLDNCMGSGTTGVACVNTGRNFIGIEKDPTYFEICKQRIDGAEVVDWVPQPPGEMCLSHKEENCKRCNP